MAQSDWYQQSLTPPEVIEFRLRLGFIPDRDHLQVLVEALDPITGAQIGQASIPHARIAEFPDRLDWAVARLTAWITEHVNPF